MRGEDPVLIHEEEKTCERERRNISKLFKRAKSNPEAVAEFEKEKKDFFEKHKDKQGQIEAVYLTAGNKYRVTLVDISGVENWLQPSVAPRAEKLRSILLVPCGKHCKLSDMDLGTGQWIRDVKYDRSDGTTEHFKKGE